MVQVANGGQRTPSGTLAHFLAADFVARGDCLRPRLACRGSYLAPDELLARSDYLRASPRTSSSHLATNDVSLAKSDYLRPPLSPRAAQQPRSSLSLRAESVEAEARCKTLRPRVQHQSYSYSVHTLRRQARAAPPCDCLPADPIPPPELFDF